MAKSHCLTIEVESPHIANGIGYLVSFVSPEDKDPRQHPEFDDWSRQITKAVIQAGDQPFNPDPYTKKLAIANLMHELDRINQDFGLQIGFIPSVPTVQIHSGNAADKHIFIDFSDREGTFNVEEKEMPDLPAGAITQHGKIDITDVKADRFPFKNPPLPPGSEIPPARHAQETPDTPPGTTDTSPQPPKPPTFFTQRF